MIGVEQVSGEDFSDPLRLLEEAVRDGEPVPDVFVGELRDAVDSGAVEVLVASSGGEAVGVALVAFRPSVSAAGSFASVEDLYVRPGSRRRGVGRALVEAVGRRCARRGVSYVEVQTDKAAAFYTALGYEEEPGVRVFSFSYASPRR